MASKLTRPTNFHPALLPHQHKYFRPEAIDALASREDLDQEREIANFFGMIDELRNSRPLVAPARLLRLISEGDGKHRPTPSPMATGTRRGDCAP